MEQPSASSNRKWENQNEQNTNKQQQKPQGQGYLLWREKEKNKATYCNEMTGVKTLGSEKSGAFFWRTAPKSYKTRSWIDG